MRATDGSGLRKRQAGFAAVPNETVWDEDLPARPLGILTKLIALPEDWDLRTEWLVEKCKRAGDGRDAVMAALRVLRRLGYYRVERRRRADGTFVSGVSVSDVRVPEWAAQHAQACLDQGTDKPKWDVMLRLLADGRVEDEPVKAPSENPQVDPSNGFSGTGEPGHREDRPSADPVTGAPAVNTQKETQTHIHPTPDGVGAAQPSLPGAPEPTGKRTPRRTRLTESWQPSAQALAATAERAPRMPVADELARFRDYHLGRGSLMADWDRAWGTWVGNWMKFEARRPQRQQPYRDQRSQQPAQQQLTDQPPASDGWDTFITGGTRP